MELRNEYTSISEAQFIPGSDTFLIKIIGPGWGSSGFYSKEVLKNSARLYSAGVHMYLNHATASELKERPERDLNSLAGYLNKDGAWWDENGPMGAGLYQEAKVFPKHLEFIRTASKIIGVSHYVLGKTRTGIIDGRTGPIVESIDTVLSVDFVTRPGAGGGIAESSRPGITGSSGIDAGTLSLYESYCENMKPETARAVIFSLTGIQIPDENLPNISAGRMSEADNLLIQSYVDSGMSEQTAFKIVRGL